MARREPSTVELVSAALVLAERIRTGEVVPDGGVLVLAETVLAGTGRDAEHMDIPGRTIDERVYWYAQYRFARYRGLSDDNAREHANAMLSQRYAFLRRERTGSTPGSMAQRGEAVSPSRDLAQRLTNGTPGDR